MDGSFVGTNLASLHMADKIRRYKKLYSDLSNKLDREPSDFEMAEALGVTLNQLLKIKQSVLIEPISLETSVTDDLCIGDYIEDKLGNSPEECAGNIFLKKSMSELFENLTEREKMVLVHRFGINSKKPMTLSELGIMMGYSKERIRQIEDGAIKKLRYNKTYSHFKDYIEN